MKKMMFSTLACVAFAFSGFASNELQESADSLDDDFLSCRIGVQILDDDGNATGDLRYDFSTTKTHEECLDKGVEFVKKLEKEGLCIGVVLIKS